MINRRVLAIILAITMATSASVSSGFDVFASEVPAAQEELTETDENILETVGEILDKKDAAEETVTEEGTGKIAEENTEEKVIEIVTDEAAGDTANDSVEEGTTVTVGTDGNSEAEQETVVKIITEEEDEEASPSEIKKASSSDADIELTAKAEDGTVVTVKASADEFPYDSLSLVAHVVEGEKAEEASEEIKVKEPEENTAKRVTYDIQVQSNGVEVQPVFGKNVKVSFSVPDIPSGADEVTVYHHEDDKVEEIATIELKEDTTAGSESVETIMSADETTVVTDDTNDEEALTSASSDTEDNYADIELENDVTIEGKTTSFSYYTVDFTYNDKTVSISGDSNHNKLSEVLAAIDITDAITDAKAYIDEECTQPAANNTVTVDGKDLFKVYEEDGIWYVDAINAFSSTHGLLVKAGEAEYKVKVTDSSVMFIIRYNPNVNTKYNGTLLSEDAIVYADKFYSCIGHTSWTYAFIQYYLGSDFHTDRMDYEAKDGYKYVCVDSDWGGDPSYPGAYVVYSTAEKTTAYVTCTVSETGTGTGNVKWKNGGNITATLSVSVGKTITAYGSFLKIDGQNDIIVAEPSADNIFVEWEGIPASGRIDDDTVIKAKFESAKSGTCTITPTPEGSGVIYPSIAVTVASGSAVSGPASSSQITVGNQQFTAASNDDSYFNGWVWLKDGKPIGRWPDNIDSDMTLKAIFSSESVARTVLLASPTNGAYEKSFEGNKLNIPNGAPVAVHGENIIVGINRSAYVKAIPNKYSKFVSWSYSKDGSNWVTLPDLATISDIKTTEAYNLRADFESTLPPEYYNESSPTSGGTSSGGSPVEEALDKTNYHSENTYGSWENPINDGEWEYLANDTWKYNSSTPMKNCWACIVNPYANVDKGQHAHDWFFFDPYGHMMTGWRMIDGKWYYFEPISNGCRGSLYMSTTTPDGYQVDANGALIQ